MKKLFENWNKFLNEDKKIMNEMAMDEMAFSMKDLEAATADVNQK
jgi:predicted double-glycine peptidase